MANISDFQKEANPNLDIETGSRESASVRVDPDEVSEYLLIGGEISEEKLKARLAKIRRSVKVLRHLVIKLDYMENLLDRTYLLNDFLFHLCYFKCFFLSDEPFFLPENLNVKIEVQNYIGNFLFNQISLLHLLPRVHLVFDLNQLEFPLDNPTHPIQTTCYFIDRVIDKMQTGHFTFYPIENHLNKFQYDYRPETTDPVALDKKAVIEILTRNFVNSPERKGSLTYSSLMLFCKMAANEFRNLNHNCLLDYRDFSGDEQGLDVSAKKPDLFRIVLQICVRATNQSVEAISTQEKAFGQLNIGGPDAKSTNVEALIEDMKKRTNKRVRWDHLRHVYIYTTPDSLIFSYKTLNPDNPLELNLISIMKPVQSNGIELHLDPVSPRLKSYKNSQGFFDMDRVPQDFFFEKLVSVVGNPLVDENFLRDYSQAFDGNKGFELNTGSILFFK